MTLEPWAKLTPAENDRVYVKDGTYPNYHELRSTSVFCGVPNGFWGGWCDRAVVAALQGCIPVMILGKGEEAPFHRYLPWEKFALVVQEADILTLPGKMFNMTFEEIMAMRRELACALPRLLWSSIYGSFLGEGYWQDAFETSLQVLNGAQPLTTACDATSLAFVESLVEKGGEAPRPNRSASSINVCRYGSADKTIGPLCTAHIAKEREYLELPASLNASSRPHPVGGAACIRLPNALCRAPIAHPSRNDLYSEMSSENTEDLNMFVVHW
ncbi:hypothetical protein CYMTET_50850 [Cymbomonas tetramitiformis]|uniref:Exostosin GT47 domain-containing protein n=1 Tax=Cymbomonas tetramitiformis TaxID=36881 RepID=A0AAE0ET07_9CHLO|nr:hypothetical protein CYMTET_50850 [Cymbomonas tetramitiformis]